MTSLLSGIKQNNADTGYYINVGSIAGRVLAYNATASGPAFSTATWCNSVGGANGGVQSALLSTLVNPGQAVLKDMGKTVVSSLRTFRKVQLVVPASLAPSTFGVTGLAGTVYPAGNDYLTGYIELGFEGAGTPAPVAQFGR